MWVLTQCNPSNRALCVTKTVLNLSITVLSNTLNLSWGGGGLPVIKTPSFTCTWFGLIRLNTI